MLNPFKEARKSANTVSLLKRMNHYSALPLRENSPVKGAFIKWYGKDDILWKMYQKYNDSIYQAIESSNLGRPEKDWFLTWERFQGTQKGPAAPVTEEIYKEKIMDGFVNEKIIISEENIKLINECARIVSYYLKSQGVFFNSTKIRFDLAWMELPNTTVRGYDYHRKGSDVDADIISKGGKTLYSAYVYFLSVQLIMAFAAFRISGKPYGEPGGIRIVYIVNVALQYIEQGISHAIKSKLKLTAPFVGWRPPEEMRKDVFQMLQNAAKDGYDVIQLDYSKFDKHWHERFQEVVYEIVASLDRDESPYIQKWVDRYKELIPNQGVFVTNEKGKVIWQKTPYQWMSGKIFTQLGGCLINIILQMLIWKKLNWGEFPINYCAVLGDDALFPVPTQILKEFGYKKILEMISEVLNEFSFKLNPDKAYPTEDPAFLTRGFSTYLNIMGVGSWTRSAGSMIWQESFKERPEGVTRMWAMALLIQIAIMSLPYSESPTSIDSIVEGIAAGFLLSVDGKARAVVSYFKHKTNSVDPTNFFKFLIKLSGTTEDQILDFMDRKSYDHTGLRDALGAKDYGKVFPFINALLKTEIPFRDAYVKEIQETDDGDYQFENSWSLVDEGIPDQD